RLEAFSKPGASLAAKDIYVNSAYLRVGAAIGIFENGFLREAPYLIKELPSYPRISCQIAGCLWYETQRSHEINCC
ncbi:MAG: hypothetical protein ABSA13_07830, partial [Beijerinckiaceae bacterium]